jgi:hypothetical protein
MLEYDKNKVFNVQAWIGCLLAKFVLFLGTWGEV